MEKLLGLKSENRTKWHSKRRTLRTKNFSFAQKDTAKLDAIYREKMVDALFGNLEHHVPTRAKVLGMKHLSGKK